jgi:hypothetical protein
LESKNGEKMEETANNTVQNLIYSTKTELVQMSKDMNFVSIFVIIYGAITCISIIGMVMGIPLIFAALRLKEAAEAFKHYAFQGDQMALNYGFEKMSNSFRIIKILIIITLIFYGLAIIAVFAVLMPLVNSFVNIPR